MYILGIWIDIEGDRERWNKKPDEGERKTEKSRVIHREKNIKEREDKRKEEKQRKVNGMGC